MRIIGTEGMSGAELERELRAGGRFVIYPYTISVIIVTMRRSSDVYFLRAGESHWSSALGYVLLSLLLGWWGIPWGPIYTVHTVAVALSGGRDVTNEVVNAMFYS